MSSLNPGSSSLNQPARRGRRVVIAGLCLGSLLVGVVVWQRRPVAAPVVVEAMPAGQTVPEAERSTLVLKEGRLHLGDGTFTGLMVEHYPGGVLKSRTAVSNGLLHGLSEGWFTNQVRQVSEHFVNGVAHGERVRWDEHGRKVAVAQIEEGKLEGTFRRWHANGQLAEEVPMKKGEAEGLARSWYTNGSLQAEVTLARGKVLKQQRYPAGGRPAHESDVVRGETP